MLIVCIIIISMKTFLYNLILFFTAAFILVMLLVLTALIPREQIRDKTLESAEYLCDGELFGTVIDNVEGSRIDRYADAILLNIAYHYDADHPVRSVM